MNDDDPILICCPYCLASMGTIDAPDEAFDPPALCARCGLDPRHDAAFELTLWQWMALEKTPCPACRVDVPTLAIRCRECRADTRARAPSPAGVSAGARPRWARADFVTGCRLLAVCGNCMVLESGETLSVMRVDDGVFVLEQHVEVDWNRGVALSRGGSLARVGEDVAVHAQNAGAWSSLPNVPGLDPSGVAFVDDALFVFPGVRNDLDAVVPWCWDGTRWSVVPLPPNEGWDSGVFGRELDGAIVHAAGVDYMLWGGAVYRLRERTFQKIGGVDLHPLRVFGLAQFGAGVIVISDRQLCLVEPERTTVLSDTLPACGVYPAPDGAVLAEYSRNDENLGAVVLWTDGTSTSIGHDWLGTDRHDASTIVPVGRTLVVIRGDEGQPRSVPWSVVVDLPRTRR